MGRTKFSELRKEVEVRPAASERLAARHAETLEEMRLLRATSCPGRRSGRDSGVSRRDTGSGVEART